MQHVRKYAFDTEFSADGAVVRASTSRLTPEAVEAERLAAYERGKMDALVQAEHKTAAAIEALATAAKAILSRLDGESRALRDDAATLALAAARKIAGAALAQFGVDNTTAAIESAMDMLRHQPRLLIKLPSDAAEQLKPRIEAIAAAHGYQGAILVRPEPSLQGGAVSIDWSDGVIVHDPVALSERLDALVQGALATPTLHHDEV